MGDRTFASPVAKTTGEGDRAPKRAWWRGKASSAESKSTYVDIVIVDAVARPLHHRLSGRRSPSPVPLRFTGEESEPVMAVAYAPPFRAGSCGGADPAPAKLAATCDIAEVRTTMTADAQPSSWRPDEHPGAELLEALASERWVVATQAGGSLSFLCHGYRDDPAVTTQLETAQAFASRRAAEDARSRYAERHRDTAHGLTGWRVLPASAIAAPRQDVSIARLERK
jgi:hypothetical protein